MRCVATLPRLVTVLGRGQHGHFTEKLSLRKVKQFARGSVVSCSPSATRGPHQWLMGLVGYTSRKSPKCQISSKTDIT